MSEKKVSNDVKELVIARLEVMPKNYKLSIGNKGTFSKEELIQHVEANDEIGSQIVQMQFNFIRALTSGRLIQTINQNG